MAMIWQQYYHGVRWRGGTAKDFRRAQFNSLSFTDNANAQLVLVVALLRCLVLCEQKRKTLLACLVLIFLSRKQVILSAPIGPRGRAPSPELSVTGLGWAGLGQATPSLQSKERVFGIDEN